MLIIIPTLSGYETMSKTYSMYRVQQVLRKLLGFLTLDHSIETKKAPCFTNKV